MRRLWISLLLLAIAVPVGKAVEEGGRRRRDTDQSGWSVDGMTYSSRMLLTIDSTKIDADLTDFVVLVKLTSAEFDFSKSNSDGHDIRFTESDGSTLLKYERERHDSGLSLAEYWVKCPSVSSSVDTTFYMYFRIQGTPDGEDAVNVWDSSYKVVLHLDDDPDTSTVQDSTSNNKDGTKKAANDPLEADGKIYKAQLWDESLEYITFSAIGSMATKTVSCWINPESVGGGGYVYFWQCLENHERCTSFGPSGTTFTIYGWENGSPTARSQSVETVDWSLGQWHYITYTFDFSGDKYVHLFLNGTECTYAQHYAIGTRGDSNYDWVLGASNLGGGYDMDGRIDEFRITNDVRTAAEIKADYHSQNNSLLTYGP